MKKILITAVLIGFLFSSCCTGKAIIYKSIKDDTGLLIIFVLVVILVSACSSHTVVSTQPVQQPIREITTNSNIQHGGMADIQDDWVFLSNWADNRKLYKQRTDGSGKEEVK